MQALGDFSDIVRRPHDSALSESADRSRLDTQVPAHPPSRPHAAPLQKPGLALRDHTAPRLPNRGGV